MVSTFTPNIQWEEPARGDQVGTWDTPVNNNGTLIDRVVGAITTISLNNSNVVLSSPQYQSKTITFNSTLTGSVIITFPTSFTKSYEIQNLCTGTSAFTITLQTTIAGGQAVSCRPGEFFDAVNDGTNIKFKNMGHIGSYWDYAGSSVPAWVSGCTVPPYLNCDGTTFSAATYPVLTIILGSTTLPDARGRLPAYLNQGTGRLTTAGAGINGNTNFSAGGNNGITLATSQIPTLTSSGTAVAPQNNFATGTGTEVIGYAAGATNKTILTGAAASNSGAQLTATSTGTGSAIVQATVPVVVVGLRLIRAG